MKPLHQTAHGKLYLGDSAAVLAKLPEQSVQCVVTSPPYWGLRDYETGEWEGGDPKCQHTTQRSTGLNEGIEGGQRYGTSRDSFAGKTECRKCGARRIDKQIGLEESPEQYVASLVSVFRQLRRVLRDDGTVWLNLGDSYSGGKGGKQGQTGQRADRRFTAEVKPKRADGIKPKDLIGIPWRVALALQADGWYLRSDVIWHQPNAMPESVTDRPSSNHEYLFLLTKKARYYYDAEAIKGKAAVVPRTRKNGERWDETKAVGGKQWAGCDGRSNKRSVWTIPVGRLKEAHFAAFPPALVAPCILAGTSAKGCCSECEAPWRRVVEKERKATRPGKETKTTDKSVLTMGNRDPARHVTATKTVGWEPDCGCGGTPVPCTVLDPFGGAMTTGLVAVRRHRNFIGIDLNAEYLKIGLKRLQKAENQRGFNLV